MASVVEPSSQGSGSQGSSATTAQPSRSKLVQRLLDASDNLPAFLHDLLTTQAILVAGTEAAGFLVGKAEDKLDLRAIAHIRPDDRSAETRQAALRAFQNIIEPCVVQSKDGAIEVGSPDGGEPQFCLVTLLRNEGQVVAAAAVITRARDVERARQRLTSMQLVAGYFDLFTLKRQSEHSMVLAGRHQNVLQYSAALATVEGFDAAAMSLCNELANRTGASRVSLGWVRGTRIRVKALSHTEKFDKKQELIVLLEQAMEECLDQEEVVRFDPDGACSPNVTRCAKQLSQSQGGNVVVSVPLRHGEDVAGVLTLEYPPQQRPDEQAEEGLMVAADLLAPQLWDRYQNDRNILVKVGISLRELARKAIGPKHMLAKLIIVLVAAAAAFVWFYKPMYHVSAPFQLVAREPRKITAPYAGLMKKANVRPGECVKAGTVLAEMVTQDIEIELKKALKQAEIKAAEKDQYAADPAKQAQRNIAEKEEQSFLAQADFFKRQMELARIIAPFDGVVLKGELYDKVNVPVKESDVLFEMARADVTTDAKPKLKKIELEVELAVADRDVQEIWIGQPGKAATTSFPSLSHPLKVKRLVPQGEVNPKEGDNVFKVYCDLGKVEPWMQPGFTGEAKLEVGKRRLGWIWTHRLVEWIQLKLWI